MIGKFAFNLLLGSKEKHLRISHYLRTNHIKELWLSKENSVDEQQSHGA